MGNMNLAVYAGLFAYHQRARLIARGNDIALDLTIDAQAPEKVTLPSIMVPAPIRLSIRFCGLLAFLRNMDYPPLRI